MISYTVIVSEREGRGKRVSPALFLKSTGNKEGKKRTHSQQLDRFQREKVEAVANISALA